jgi:hypothetical protein
MLDMGIETSRLPQAKMITRQHRTRLIGIAGSCSGTPGGVSLDGIQPADQVAGGASHRRSTGQRIRPFEMEPPHAGDAGNRLGADLNEIVLASQGHSAADDGVLRRFGNGRSAAFRRTDGRPRVTGYQPADQEGTRECPATRHFANYAAHDGG